VDKGGAAPWIVEATMYIRCLLLAVCSAFVAQSFGADIWEEPVLAQPFEQAPFRPVRLPEWVRETIGVGYTLSGMNTAQRERAVAAGVTISEFGFVDPLYAYYDSNLLLKRSPHVPLERLDKDMAEYRQLGIRMLGVYPPSLQGEVYEKHQEWRRISKNTTEIPQVDMEKQPFGGMLCLLGSYGDFFIDVLAEIVTKYPDVAAFSFDGLHYGGVCYCANCRDAYRKDTGQEIPTVNMEETAFRHYQHWADRRMESLIVRMQTRLKRIKPNVALVTWTTNAGRFGHFRDIPRNMPARMNLLLDAPDQEFWMDETNRGASIVPAFGNAYAWATTNHRVAFSEPYLMSHGNPYGKDSFPAHEIERRMLLVLTHGATPSLAVGQSEAMQEAAYHALAEVQKRKPWLTDKEPEPWAALVMSDNTRVFYGRSSGKVEERYLANVFGVFRAAIEEHLPLTLINDWNLTDADLAKYKVLVLANTASLDLKQCEAVRRFVQNGGGLIASLDASLCDEFGDPRADFALADVFGANHRGVPTADSGVKPGELDVNFARSLGPEYWEKRKSVWQLQRCADFPLSSPKLTDLIGTQSVLFKGPAIRVGAREGGRVLATLAPQGGEKGEPIPAIVANTVGKGRVLFFAAGIDAANYLYSYPYHRALLRNALEWAAGTPPPILVVAPMCVHAVSMRQKKDGERLIVHLYNDVNTTANHALPDDDVPLREETLPIHDIRVSFRGYKLGRVHLEPGGLELEKKADGEQISVTVPRLDVHAMVVAELTAAAE
jgi:hypothetical protein